MNELEQFYKNTTKQEMFDMLYNWSILVVGTENRKKQLQAMKKEREVVRVYR